MNALARLLALRVAVSALSEDDWSDVASGFLGVVWPGSIALWLVVVGSLPW